MSMLSRRIEKELKTTAKEYPVVTIIGPRQSGKTTLARNLFHDHAYVYLENPELCSLALEDPKSSRIYRSKCLKGIRYFQKLSGSNQPGLLIYDGELEIEKEEAVIKNFRNVWP